MLKGMYRLVAIVLVIGTVGIGALDTPQVPVIRGDLGPCSADFTVTDSSGKPLYDAKIHVLVRYGFLSKRKSDLEIGTNSDGKARIEGLPAKVKRPLDFEIRQGEDRKSVLHDPALDCHPTFKVVLGPQ